MTSVSGLVPIVRKIAWRVGSTVQREADREDMIQEGVVGLLEAAQRYEPGRGCSMRTFGGRRAAGAMLDHLRGMVRRSREAPEPNPGETGGSLATSPDNRSMESAITLQRFRRFLGRVASLLPDSEREVITLRYFESLTVRDVAARLSTSPATVVRIERRALGRLREAFLESGGGRETGA
jgi:RNA polymerase sigma factor (sigma-70 family)